jgi:hypothetical protein
MPQHSPSSVGTAALRKAYDVVFAAITLTVEFEIAEIRQIAPDWVLARTNSAGHTKNNATGAEGPEANQELFCSRRSAGPGRSHATVFVQPTRHGMMCKRGPMSDGAFYA